MTTYISREAFEGKPKIKKTDVTKKLIYYSKQQIITEKLTKRVIDQVFSDHKSKVIRNKIS